MKCVILAAGYATRMYPLTENFPKPLLEVGEKTILDWLVDDISSSCNISEFVVISNHKFISHFEKWGKERKEDVIVLDDGSIDNDHRLGAVKDIEFAINTCRLDDNLLVIAGDNLLDFSFSSFVDFARRKDSTCIMRYYTPEIKEGKKYCVCSVDENDKVTEMREKVMNPTSHWLVPPFYVYKKSDLHYISEALTDGCPFDAPGSFIEWLCKRSVVHAMEMPGKRFDVGNIEGYEKIKAEYKGVAK